MVAVYLRWSDKPSQLQILYKCILILLLSVAETQSLSHVGCRKHMNAQAQSHNPCIIHFFITLPSRFLECILTWSVHLVIKAHF